MLSFYELKFQKINCINVTALIAFKMIIMITMKSCSQKARQAFDVNRLSFMEAHGFQQIDANLDSVLTFLSGIQTCPGDNSRF